MSKKFELTFASGYACSDSAFRIYYPYYLLAVYGDPRNPYGDKVAAMPGVTDRNLGIA